MNYNKSRRDTEYSIINALLIFIGTKYLNSGIIYIFSMLFQCRVEIEIKRKYIVVLDRFWKTFPPYILKKSNNFLNLLSKKGKIKLKKLHCLQIFFYLLDY